MKLTPKHLQKRQMKNDKDVIDNLHKNFIPYPLHF